MADRGAWLCGLGMMTPVGDCAAQTATSVRAGISRYRESPIYNRSFNPMTLALLPEKALPPLDDILARMPGVTSRQARMLRLAAPALRETLQLLGDGEGLPLFLAGPEPLPDRPPPVSEAFLDQLIAQSGVLFDRQASRIFPTGRAGGLQALEAAVDALDQGRRECVLVGGVDSYLDLYLLGTLDMEGRVLAEGVMDGFCPGEGAGFLLLATPEGLAAHGLEPLAFVSPPGLAAEPGHRYSEEPYRGDGLGQAVALAFERGSGEPVRTVFGSLNGENFGAKEWGVAQLRNSAAFAEGFRFEHPADCFGDLGAAFAPVLTGLAALGMKRSYLPAPALVWCSSERELRGAACIRPAADKET